MIKYSFRCCGHFFFSLLLFPKLTTNISLNAKGDNGNSVKIKFFDRFPRRSPKTAPPTSPRKPTRGGCTSHGARTSDRAPAAVRRTGKKSNLSAAKLRLDRCARGSLPSRRRKGVRGDPSARARRSLITLKLIPTGRRIQHALVRTLKPKRAAGAIIRKQLHGRRHSDVLGHVHRRRPFRLANPVYRVIFRPP
jgi:hypothetical protein